MTSPVVLDHRNDPTLAKIRTNTRIVVMIVLACAAVLLYKTVDASSAAHEASAASRSAERASIAANNAAVAANKAVDDLGTSSANGSCRTKVKNITDDQRWVDLFAMVSALRTNNDAQFDTISQAADGRDIANDLISELCPAPLVSAPDPPIEVQRWPTPEDQ